MHEKSQSGQALLLVLLSVGVVLTIALSLVSRSVGDVSNTTKDEESLRAFSAAEAGVEEILKTPIIINGPTSTNTPAPVEVGNPQTTYQTISNAFPENPRAYLYPSELASGDTATIWLAGHDNNGDLTCTGVTCYTATSIDLCWGKVDASVPAQPALVVSVMYEDPTAGNALKFAYGAYDPSSSRGNTNKFQTNGITTNPSNGACTISGTRLANRVSVSFAALGIPNAIVNGRRLRAITGMVLYNGAPTVFGATNLPTDLPIQGRRIDSTGTSGDATRKVQVYSLYPEVPTMFQAAIFSPPGVVK